MSDNACCIALNEVKCDNTQCQCFEVGHKKYRCSKSCSDSAICLHANLAAM